MRIEVTVPDPVIGLIEAQTGAKGDKGDPGDDGAPGAAGATGAAGVPGQGVATGGTTGQVFTKASNTNYDTEWTDEIVGCSVGLAAGLALALG